MLYTLSYSCLLKMQPMQNEALFLVSGVRYADAPSAQVLRERSGGSHHHPARKARRNGRKSIFIIQEECHMIYKHHFVHTGRATFLLQPICTCRRREKRWNKQKQNVRCCSSSIQSRAIQPVWTLASGMSWLPYRKAFPCPCSWKAGWEDGLLAKAGRISLDWTARVFLRQNDSTWTLRSRLLTAKQGHSHASTPLKREVCL